MGLNFDSGAYAAAYGFGQRARDAENERLLQLLGGMGQGIGGLTEAYQQNKQMQLKKLLMEEEKKKQGMTLNELSGFNSTSSLSQPVSPMERIDQMQPQQMENFQPQIQSPMDIGMNRGEVPQGPMAQRMNHVENFQNFLKGQTQPQQPQATPQSPWGDLGGMNLDQASKVANIRESMFKSQPKPEQPEKFPGSIDAILAQKVNSGEMTLQEAVKMKQQSGGGSFMSLGVDSSGSPVFANTKDPKNMMTVPLPGGGILYPKTPPEGAMNASLFGQRALQANQQLKNMIDGSFDPTSYETGALRLLPNIAQPENVQKLEQAENNFMAAILRKESGALISREERIEGGKQYFPRAGDKLGTLQQKEINRQTAIEGLNRMAGPMRDRSGAETQQPIIKEQRNKRTSEIRKIQSLDGGQTWQPM